MLTRTPLAQISYVLNAVATHPEVRDLPTMLGKLRAYGRYGAAVGSVTDYRPLTMRERLLILARCIRERDCESRELIVLLWTLIFGLPAFESGRRGGA